MIKGFRSFLSKVFGAKKTAEEPAAAQLGTKKRTMHVVVRKGHRKQYLRANSYVEDPKKWTTDLNLADRWLVPDNAHRYASRILKDDGDDFTVEKMP